MAVVFLDSAYAIALSAATAQFHPQAVRLAEQLASSQTKLITTRAILLEIGNALSKVRYRSAAVRLLQAIEADPNVEVVALSEDLYARAFCLYCDRMDREWGLIDCISCVVMQERNIADVLTTDEHFRQMGFQILMQSE